ncbi:MAG TPA: VCBS repeat-containing protein [Kofleriaceae bacterium]|nr:VCBS repeat-containing protein [Kofleriaceae bacterium]
MIQTRVRWCAGSCLIGAVLFGCGGKGAGGDDDDGGGSPLPLPSPACAAATTGSATVAAPQLAYTLQDRFQEAFLGSPSVADLDSDGTPEIIVPRDDLLVVWHTAPGGGSSVAWTATLPGRIWASPIVADLVPGPSSPGLEVAVASRNEIVVYSATGKVLPGFPFTWQDELRSIAAGDIDGDGKLELVAVTTTPLDANNQRDSVIAIHTDGTVVAGFPPNTTGAAQCDATCFITGGYDQNLAIGDVDGDHKVDVFVSQDDAYMALHDGSGLAFDAAPIFAKRKKFSGVRWMVDYALAQQGFANDEDTDLQAHFTNTGPAIADLDGDGTAELIALGSIQNASQTDRLKGVGLFVSHHDGTRPADWVAPPMFPDYLGGLWDNDDSEGIVGMTNQVAVADIDPSHPGLEVVFAGFDGKIHAVDAHGKVLWDRAYTTDTDVWTSGVVVADLSGDGVPEIVFTTYGPAGGDLIVLDAAGNELHRIALGGRGAMPVPTIADVDGDGDLDIVVSLKDAVDKQKSAVVYEVPGSAGNCLLWPTARGNDRRDGYLPPK